MTKKTSNTFKLNTQNLKDALEKVKPGLANKEFIETTTHYLFYQNKIITYNDKICISFNLDFFPISFAEKIFSVKAKDFYNIIKTIKSSEFTCKVSDKTFKIKSTDTEASININTEDMSVKNMYDDLYNPQPKFKALENAEDFMKALSLCRFSASKDATNQNLYCVSVTKDRICSADNYRASYYNIEENIPSFLIPATSVNELINYNVGKICVMDNWVHFETDENLRFSSRLVAGDYPDLSPMFEKKKSQKIILPSELSSILSEVSVMSQGDTDFEKEVDIHIENNVLSCTSKKDIGWLKKKMKIDSHNKDFSFQINPVFLAQILNKSDQIEITDNIAYFATDKFSHLIAISSGE
jgi:DNA polymerase III sliding clamp (beta) subunit (PCNA family)